MNVRMIGQGRGAVHAAPRPGRGQGPGGNGTAPDDGTRAVRSPGTETQGSAAAVVFDSNGDGVIESWSFAHGGDSFANFAPPPRGASGSNGTSAHHGADPRADAEPAHSRAPDHAPAHASTPVAVHHAHSAYQRDGMSNVSGSGPAPAATGSAPVHASTAGPSSPTAA